MIMRVFCAHCTLVDASFRAEDLASIPESGAHVRQSVGGDGVINWPEGGVITRTAPIEC